MLLLIADDLTGCCDAGIHFARRGMASAVAFSRESLLAGAPADFDVLALNTASRNIPSAQAAKAVAGAMSAISQSHGIRTDLVFKKIDSTMRGNPGAELDALMLAGGFKTAFIAPSSPRHGRAVVDGVLFVNCVPVAKTAFARDPVTPMRESAPRDILAAQSSRRADCVPLAALRAGPTEAKARVAALLASGVEYIIFDAESLEDLRLIARLGLEMSPRPIFAGSGGLAEALSDSLPEGDSPRDFAAPTACPLFVCGSANHAALEQIEVLEAAGTPVFRLPRDFQDAEALRPILEKTEAALALGPAALAAPRCRLARVEDSLALTESMAALTLEILQKGRPLSLFMTGGETAFAILRRIGRFMSLEREFEPGVVAGKLLDGHWAGMDCVAKAGGFGNRQTLLKARNILLGQEAS